MEERWENNTCYQTQWPENTSFHSTQHISVILCWLLPWMETWGPFTNIVIITDLISYNPLVDPNGPRGLWQSTEWLYACSIDYYLWCFVLKVNTYDHQCVFTVKRRKLFPYNFEEAITAHLYVIWCCLWDWRGMLFTPGDSQYLESWADWVASMIPKQPMPILSNSDTPQFESL